MMALAKVTLPHFFVETLFKLVFLGLAAIMGSLINTIPFPGYDWLKVLMVITTVIGIIALALAFFLPRRAPHQAKMMNLFWVCALVVFCVTLTFT